MKLHRSPMRRPREWVGKHIRLLSVAGVMIFAGISGVAVLAEGGDDFTRIVGTNGYSTSLWTPNNKTTSPDGSLNWIFDGNGSYNNGIEHVIKNEVSSQVRKTNLRVYFKDNPGAINFNVAVPTCEFTLPGSEGNVLNMTVGGTLVYSQRAAKESRITQRNDYYDWNAAETSRSFDRSTYDRVEMNSRSCIDLGGEPYNVLSYNERKANNRPPRYNNPGTTVNGGANDPISSNCSSVGAGYNTCRFARSYTGPIMGIDPDTGYFYTDIIVSLDGNRNNTNTRQQIRYKIDVTTPGAIVGYKPSSDPTEFGLGANIASNNTQGVKLAIPFGLPCTETNTLSKSVGLYDPDVGQFGPTYMVVYEKDPRTGQARRLTNNNPSPEYTALSQASFQDPFGNGGRLSVSAGNDQLSSFNINMRPGYQYMLIVSNPHNGGYPSSPLGNVFSVQLPTYSVPGLIPCYYKLTPSIDTVQSTFQGSPNIPVHGYLTSDGGNIPGARDWRVSKIVFDSRPTFKTANGQTTEDPCAWMRSGNPPGRDCSSLANNSYPATSDWRNNFTDPANYPLGTYVCFVTSVRQPEFGFQVNEWSHSNMTCSVKGALPKVQVWGHDVQSGAQIQTSITNMNNRAYGSWGEYALLSAGRNNGMASASRLATGNPSQTQASWLELTASNTPGCGGGNYGCYGTQSYPQSIVDGIRALSTAPCSGSISTSSINIGDKNNVTGTHVICSTGTVTVDTNIQYAATNTKSDLPQVLIVARDIVIADAVSRVDAWLVAGNGNPASGTLYTCSSWRSIGTQLDASVCPTRLVVNGPVIAPRILLGRTYDNEGDNFRDGAETVNLRADTFIWSSQGSGDIGAETVTVKELPPRY